MTTTDPIPDKLNITQDDVVKVIKRISRLTDWRRPGRLSDR
jgi:hypothetical protein